MHEVSLCAPSPSRPSRWRRIVGHLAVLSIVAGCGTAEPPKAHKVEIFSWWVSGGEVDALNALLRVYTDKNPGTSVTNSAVTGSDYAREQLQGRMIKGFPPDTFQCSSRPDIMRWVLYNGIDDSQSKMEPLDDLAAANNWRTAIPKEVLDSVSYAGHVYAIPVNIHRLNSFFYSVKVFRDHGIPRPQTLDDFFAAAEKLKREGVTPIAVGSSAPWTLGLATWQNFLLARAGSAYYTDFFNGKKSADDPEIAQAIGDLGRLVDNMNANAMQLSWDQAVELVRTGGAGMTIMGDWAKGYLVSNGAKVGIDFDGGPMPGTQGQFMFGADSFGLPRGAPDRADARALLTVFGSPDGQLAFNAVKGSIPSRTDVDTSTYDSISQLAAADFKTARLAVNNPGPPQFQDVVNAALRQYTQDRDASAVVYAIKNRYDELKNQK